MRFPIKSIALAAVLLAGTAVQARAEVFVWQDPASQLTISFPETWQRMPGVQPDEVLHVVGPNNGAYADCRVRVSADRRFVIYPRQYAGEIQRINYSRSFWDQYIGEFDGAVINGVWDNAGLGDGFASYADVSFNTQDGPKVAKRGLMFASVYNDKAYIVECSSEASVFNDWYKPFLSVVKSVDFHDEYQTRPYHWYRDFFQDDAIRIRGRKDSDLYTY